MDDYAFEDFKEKVYSLINENKGMLLETDFDDILKLQRHIVELIMED